VHEQRDNGERQCDEHHAATCNGRHIANRGTIAHNGCRIANRDARIQNECYTIKAFFLFSFFSYLLVVSLVFTFVPEVAKTIDVEELTVEKWNLI